MMQFAMVRHRRGIKLQTCIVFQREQYWPLVLCMLHYNNVHIWTDLRHTAFSCLSVRTPPHLQLFNLLTTILYSYVYMLQKHTHIWLLLQLSAQHCDISINCSWGCLTNKYWYDWIEHDYKHSTACKRNPMGYTANTTLQSISRNRPGFSSNQT